MPTKINPFAGRLSDEDSALFYKLWMGLLDYVNQVHGVDKSLGKLTSPAGLDIRKLMPIRDKLWSEITAIDEYIFNSKSKLSDEEVAILKGWKKAVSGDFIVMKHLKNYSVLMTNEASPLLYGSIGIMSTWEELIPKGMLPTSVNCTLIPFKGKIINDSFLRGGNICYGSGYKSSFNDAYRTSKALYGIITSFDNLDEILAQHTAGNARRKRILDEILVDTNDEHEQISAWHCYLQDKIIFPFEAICEKQMIRSPLQIGEKVTVTGLAKINDGGEGIAIVINWMGRSFAVPLEQLKPADANADFSEAVEDWKYWMSAGYFC